MPSGSDMNYHQLTCDRAWLHLSVITDHCPFCCTVLLHNYDPVQIEIWSVVYVLKILQLFSHSSQGKSQSLPNSLEVPLTLEVYPMVSQTTRHAPASRPLHWLFPQKKMVHPFYPTKSLLKWLMQTNPFIISTFIWTSNPPFPVFQNYILTYYVTYLSSMSFFISVSSTKIEALRGQEFLCILFSDEPTIHA